jgi:hypothetical protein
MDAIQHICTQALIADRPGLFFLNERHKIVPISLIKRVLQPASREGQKKQN